MSEDKIFAQGLIYKAPRENAPDFVKGSLSIKTEEFTKFLEDHTKPDGWVNLDLKVSRGGKLYCELNQYSRPVDDNQHRSHRDEAPNPIDEPNPDDIPF
jgi:hypothetical protein